MPITCSTRPEAGSASSLQPLARAVAMRCGRALKPSRSSDEAPPWQRGPVGRRPGAGSEERREDVMNEAFGAPREGNIRLQGRAREQSERNECARPIV
jgi:hypothetical protein